MTHSPKATVLALNAIALSLVISAVPQRAAAGDLPFIGEILRVPYNFCPTGTFDANGQLVSINNYIALYALIGTTYGGDGQVSFAVPDLRGRAPIGTSNSVVFLGQKSGQEQVTLNASQMAAHSHTVNATNADGNLPGPGNKLLAAAPPGGVGQETIYSDQPATVTMSPTMISPTGGGQAFPTLDPYVVIRYCIVYQGLFPSRP
ncbi:phage tail protein [Pseudotabrizicola alkalilacus]|uniref:Phage tail protein n=1 Tax=Pseudotabrizicola alkalilacus TaxID=2305252 RepID=A0A411YYM1_9RHOB|nr:tail fiber protein [Pseudotabrizicola alkalilacus]RGP35971.1 phage tail protein [Pseudotabrizicola alkalilacus]